MSLPIPLTVRLSTARADRHITRDLRDLSFRSAAPGGFAAARFSLHRPLAIQADEIAYYARVYIYDARNGNVVWEGRLEDPGRGAGSDGQVWELAAMGSSAHARDTTAQYIVMDTSLERWKREPLSARTGDFTVTERDADTAAIVFRANEGVSIPTSWFMGARYSAIQQAHQELARVSATVVNGANTTLWSNRLVTREDFGAGTNVDVLDWSTTDTAMAGAKGGGTAIPDGHNVVEFRIIRTGTASVASDNVWGEFINVAVKAVLFNADGSEITSGYTVPWTFASSIVNDMLGRFLDKYDGANSSVEATSFQMEQAAWPDGVTPADVFDDLMLIEPAFYWAAWETNPVTDKWRFEWRRWPTTVRYEADVVDGYQSSGSASELFNRVRARYRTPHGYTHFSTRTSTVAELTEVGLTRTAFIDLGEEVGLVVAQAAQAGDQFLLEHATPPNAGQLTVARPIYDQERGMMVAPWEIRPGHLIRVRGILANRNTLNVAERDGVTVFRIVGVDYDTASASATLELDSYSTTVSRALATLGTRRITRRR